MSTLMTLADVASLLKETIGLDADSIGALALERVVSERVAASGALDLPTYWTCLQTSRTELQELVEAIVVNETWFFRDREAFTTMVRFVHEEWLPKNQTSILRVLSLPCSTGEEPFSMAMALMDSNFAPERFKIDGVDISERAIARANSAVYGRNSFRGKDMDFRARYFKQVNNLYQLSDQIHAQVRLVCSNMFDADFMPGTGLFDVIFCRNVLIYFDRATQDRAIEVLLRLLKHDGLLFAGHSESGLFLEHNFVSVKSPLAFAFRRPGTERARKENGTQSFLQPRPIKTVEVVRQNPKIKERIPPAPLRQASPFAAPATSTLSAARSLADRGHFSEATHCCEEHVRAYGPSPDAYCLLGIIRDATGNHIDAATYYRKAIYLDPRHRDALVHLALLLRERGDVAGAKTLEARITRLTNGGTS